LVVDHGSEHDPCPKRVCQKMSYICPIFLYVV
jgi:hypothetical protein